MSIVIINKLKSALLRIYYRTFGIIIADIRIKKQYYKQNDPLRVIKVGFIVQMPEIWNVQEPVYKELQRRKQFEPWLIIVPQYNSSNSIMQYGTEKDFFINKCENNMYIMALNDGEWIKIQHLSFDYIFYQRPYDALLPPNLRSHTVAGFSKVCYIPYATPGIKETVIYPRNFFINIYLGFMEDENAALINNKRYKDKTHRRFWSIGYPPLQHTFPGTQTQTHDINTVLWTPRWTYDHKVGGSHFVEYWERFINRDWGDERLIVRPHPMMWEYFLKNGIITESQIERIKRIWNENGILLDSNKNIEDTFGEVDILISDMSSVMPIFFLTGRPIIYCPPECEHSAFFLKMIPGCYIANDWDEVNYYAKRLLAGIDEKKETRKRIIEKFFTSHGDASSNIAECIISDFKRLSYRY